MSFLYYFVMYNFIAFGITMTGILKEEEEFEKVLKLNNELQKSNVSKYRIYFGILLLAWIILPVSIFSALKRDD